MLLYGTLGALTSGTSRPLTFGDRPAPLTVSAVSTALEIVVVSAVATVEPFLLNLSLRWLAAAHCLGVKPLLHSVRRPTIAAVITTVANAFLIILALSFAIGIAMWCSLLR